MKQFIYRLFVFLAILSIVSSLLMSGVCSGPIDQIFMGWRDSTACMWWSGRGCLGTGVDSEQERTAGVVLLVIFLIIIVLLFASFKLLRKIKRSCCKSVN